MKIIDLRSPVVRRFTRQDGSPTRPSAPVRFWGKITDHIQRRRAGGRPDPGDGPFLISIGNLALGGTGKTPVVMSLAASLAGMGVSGAVLTRGYGSTLKGPAIVDPSDPLAGDEARLMAGRLAEMSWPVIQARHRPKGLAFIRERRPEVNVVLLEDAHQTRNLPRHLDLVLLDSWLVNEGAREPVLEPVTGPVFPFGPWRESAAGARRASAFLVESQENLPALASGGQEVFSFRRRVELRQVHGSRVDVQIQKWALVSGIARPSRFEKAALGALQTGTTAEQGESAVLAMRCPDHAAYSSSLVARLQTEMKLTGAQALVTTAKDWVKLSSLWQGDNPVLVLDLELDWEKEDALNQWLVERIKNKVEATGF